MTPFFDSWSAFWQMGQHGFYVWLSYGISFVAILLLVITSHRGKKKILSEVNKEMQRQQRIKQHKTMENSL
ncbi:MULTISPECIES: heme exporter protein CcmD [Gallibacterium]|uniref:Heme exporter protein D n=1 Tax=Gallibacterium genomosp. 3 TaxID=505345 RepID=A0A1A7NPA4_9PAST|nr:MULTISPECIES: heme exporter protein CcmD [Gallibacterium]MDA3979340.1 heme exporter protein CcmD [Gallibacterium sp. AGMB14963]OBW91458.1 hemagglutination activity protein [Gallibacterium genomosp. 3]OBX10687.1 hemagglutination activity protein [Gallibacterium genomosp. 3]